MRATTKFKPGAAFGLRIAMPAVAVPAAHDAPVPRDAARTPDGAIVLPALPSIFHSPAGDGDHAGLPAPTIH